MCWSHFLRRPWVCCISFAVLLYFVWILLHGFKDMLQKAQWGFGVLVSCRWGTRGESAWGWLLWTDECEACLVKRWGTPLLLQTHLNLDSPQTAALCTGPPDTFVSSNMLLYYSLTVFLIAVMNPSIFQHFVTFDDHSRWRLRGHVSIDDWVPVMWVNYELCLKCPTNPVWKALYWLCALAAQLVALSIQSSASLVLLYISIWHTTYGNMYFSNICFCSLWSSVENVISPELSPVTSSAARDVWHEVY